MTWLIRLPRLDRDSFPAWSRFAHCEVSRFNQALWVSTDSGSTLLDSVAPHHPGRRSLNPLWGATQDLGHVTGS